MRDLEAASIEDVREFYQTYYVPENATLVIVGDFDMAQAKAIVSQYFGRVPKAEHPVPRDIPKEPPQTREKRVTVEAPWPLPAVVVAYHITYDGHPDSYPLHIASKVLSDGQSSRIYQELVYGRQLAVTAFGGANLIEDPNPFLRGGDPARAAAGRDHQGTDWRTGQAEGERSPSVSSRGRRTSLPATTSSAGVNRKAAARHAVVIHNDIKTADEFTIFRTSRRLI